MQWNNNKGFTLAEVLIVIVIFAIGAAIAIPNIMQMGQKGKVKTAARQLKDQMAKARISAIELNMPVVVVFDKIVDGTSSGYQIVQDTNGDCEVDAGELTSSIRISGAAITANNLTPNNAGNPIVQWNTRGFPLKKGGTFANGTISFSGINTQFDVVLSKTGNVRIQ
ncbi:MAG: GspH/FimT family protein [Desulfuromonadales bacterium]|nr:GspH/FimT family protein [Desulfuromonadales bacterium]